MMPKGKPKKSKLIRITDGAEGTKYLGIVTEEGGKRTFLDIIGSHKNLPKSGHVERTDISPNSSGESKG